MAGGHQVRQANTGQLSMRFVGMSIPFSGDIGEIGGSYYQMEIRDASKHGGKM